MAFTATFYSFAKKVNSTAQPTGGTNFSIELKDSTDILHPVITLRTSYNPYNYNYCKIVKFSRYYWVRSWEYDSGIWTAFLSCDVLATFKSGIGGSTQYVKRAYSAYDPDIIDVYPRKAGSGITYESEDSGMVGNISAMAFVVGVTSADPSNATIGTTVYYATDYSTIKAFIAHLVSMSYITFTDITDQLAKWLCNPFQWIKSIIVLPVSYSSVSGTSASSIKFGADENGYAFSFSCSCKIITSTNSIDITGAVDVPKHPDLDTIHNYLQAEPYSQYSLLFPPFGKLNIPSSVLYDKSELHFRIRIDPVTGGGTLYIGKGTYGGYGAICIADAQLGVSLPVDAAVVDLAASGTSALIAGGISAAGTAVGNYENGGNILDGVLTSFIDGALSSVSTVQTISSGGKLCDLGLPLYLFLEYYVTVGQDPAHYGYPLAQTKTINTLSGFILCDHAEVAISNATYAEQREIEGFMESGFFYE